MESFVLFTKSNCKFCELVKGHIDKQYKGDGMIQFKNTSYDYEALADSNFYDIMSFPALVDENDNVYRTIEEIFKRLGI